jgi:hypothetical protein
MARTARARRRRDAGAIDARQVRGFVVRDATLTFGGRYRHRREELLTPTLGLRDGRAMETAGRPAAPLDGRTLSG